MATEEAVAAGLIDWINSLEAAQPVYTIDDLGDGDVIWKTLQQVDTVSFPGSLPEQPSADQWIQKWTNLKHVYDALSMFLVEDCNQRLHSGSQPDLKAIAQSSSLPETIRLLKLVVVAAMECANRVDFLERMQELGTSTQEVLMTTAKENDDANQLEPEEQPEDEMDESFDQDTKEAGGVDFDLASEERLGKVIADNSRLAHEKRDLDRQLEEANSRYERLRESHDQSQDELKQANDRLTAVLAGKGEGASGRAGDVKNESVIETLEARLLEADAALEDLRKSNEVLKIKAEKAQKLQDDYDEIKIDRDKLSRKANVAEKYKQKLETIQETERENQNLKNKIDELQTQLKQSDSSRLSGSDLQRENDEYRRLLPSIEQDRYDLNEMKKRLELELHALEARYRDAQEQLQRQSMTVEDLQGRLRDYEDSTTGPPSPKHEAVTDTTEANDNTTSLEDLELTAENESLLTSALVNGHGNADADKDGGNDISESELRSIMSALRAQAQASHSSAESKVLLGQKRLVIAIERSRQREGKLKEHVIKQSELIGTLKGRTRDSQTTSLQTQENESEPPTDDKPTPTSEPTAQNEVDKDDAVEEKLEEQLMLNENLRRELRLMASAWHEQQLRIASAGGIGTIAGRGAGGAGEPKSFLGRQRKVVNKVVLGTTS